MKDRIRIWSLFDRKFSVTERSGSYAVHIWGESGWKPVTDELARVVLASYLEKAERVKRSDILERLAGDRMGCIEEAVGRFAGRDSLSRAFAVCSEL